MTVEEAKAILKEHGKGAISGTREMCAVCLAPWPCESRWAAAFVMADHLARED